MTLLARGLKGAGGGARGLKQKVRSARQRKPASTRWLTRQLNDPYVAAAAAAGYRSRAAYKLIEIDDKLKILKPGLRVLDLGAAPGGWSQVAVARVRSTTGGGRVVAVDVQEIKDIKGVTTLKLDLAAGEGAEEGNSGGEGDALARALREALGGAADVVLSDMAAAATGHAPTDHLRTVLLAEAAIGLAGALLAPGGALVVKLLQGAEEGALFTTVRAQFQGARRIKPAASRPESRELYVVGTGFRGAPARIAPGQ